MNKDADVFLLAAGLGTRLKPLTDSVPKPLISVKGKTLLERNLEMIADAGFLRVIINLHYLPEQIREYVGNGERWGISVDFVEESRLLDTGGAIRNIEPLLHYDDLITINSDILLGSGFSLAELLEKHQTASDTPLITMCLKDHPLVAEFGEIGVDEAGRVVSLRGEYFGPGKIARNLVFIGVQVINRRVMQFMPPRGSIFSITRDTIRYLLERQELVSSFIYDGFWSDVGTIERLREVS